MGRTIFIECNGRYWSACTQLDVQGSCTLFEVLGIIGPRMSLTLYWSLCIDNANFHDVYKWCHKQQLEGINWTNNKFHIWYRTQLYRWNHIENETLVNNVNSIWCNMYICDFFEILWIISYREYNALYKNIVLIQLLNMERSPICVGSILSGECDISRILDWQI